MECVRGEQPGAETAVLALGDLGDDRADDDYVARHRGSTHEA